MSESIYVGESQVNLTEAEIHRLKIQPGEILIVTIKSDELTQASMASLRKGLMAYFPNNKVIVLGTGSEGSISLTVAQAAVYEEPKVEAKVDACGSGPANYCNDCSCGKKAAYEGSNG